MGRYLDLVQAAGGAASEELRRYDTNDKRGLRSYLSFLSYPETSLSDHRFDVPAESGLPDSGLAFQLRSSSTTKTTETTKVGLDTTAGDATAGSLSWADGFAALSHMPALCGFSPKRWRRIIDATGIFLDRWGNQAAQCGWSDLDLFGCHLDRPDARFDCMGLVLLLDRAEVISLDCEAATLKTGTGSELRYRRRPLPAGTVPLWDLR